MQSCYFKGFRGVPQDPFAPRRGPLGPSPDRDSAIGNDPALVKKNDARTFGSTARPAAADCVATPGVQGGADYRITSAVIKSRVDKDKEVIHFNDQAVV